MRCTAGSGVGRVWMLVDGVAVAPQEVDDRVVGKPERVVHPEPVRTAAFGLVERDLLSDADVEGRLTLAPGAAMVLIERHAE